ncbi:MAG: hypothetical protein ACI3XQ_08450, partial [Eubacteriales bacterium]
MKRKMLCGVLAVLMFILSLGSCKKENAEETTKEQTVLTDGSTEEEYNIEGVDYGGRDFIILASTVSEDGGRHFSEYGGDLAGDHLMSSIYYRDRAIMEKYKITIQVNTTTNWNTELTNSMLSDDLMFHVATPGVSNAVYSITQGSISCLDDYP